MCYKFGDKVFLFIFIEVGFVEGIVYVFVIVVFLFIWMVRWFVIFFLFDIVDVVVVFMI